MPHGAVDVRVYTRVIEGAGQDRHRRRSCVAAVDGSFVIATLPGGEAADNQPDDEDRRSDVHLDLLSIICVNINRQPIAMRPYLSRNLGGSIPVRGDTRSGARESRAFSRNLEAAGDLLTAGGAGPHPRSRGLPD